jgi:predicted ATPase
MRLTRLHLRNFKACQAVDLEMAPLTVLIGANNAGKSSILHAIALLAQSDISGQPQPAGALVDLGASLDALVHRDGRAAPIGPAEIRLVWAESADQPAEVDFALQFGATRRQVEVGEEERTLVSDALRRFRYVGANRHVERSVFPLGAQSVANPRTAQELVDTLAYNDELLDRVSERCQTIFGYGVDKDLIENRQITIVAKGRSLRRNVVNLGTGFIQTVWLLTQLELALAQPPAEPWSITPLVGIEEPELHIHPGRQPDIARLLAAFVGSGLDLVCTTQSEHLLLALLSLVLEGELTAGQIVVYYLREGEAERLVVDEQGRIEGGLRGFFEANEEQLRRHIELLKQRG